MFWVHLKIILALTIPFSTIAYAREVRHENDRRQIQSTLQRRIDIQWTCGHPQDALKQDRAELQSLNRLLQDLDS